MKEQKFLYETVVWRQTEEKETTVTQVDGQEVSTTKLVKKNKPVKVAILKPNRRLYENADIFYAKTLADYIKIGLLPYSLVAKRYSNDGGALSESQKTHIIELREESAKLEREFFGIGATTDLALIEKKNLILIRLNVIANELNTIENSYADVFDNTADMKARSKTIEWWSLFLSFIDEDGTGYKNLYGAGTLEEKLEKYDEIDELSNEFYNEVIRKLAYLISFYFASKGAVEHADLLSMEGVYKESVSSYKIYDETSGIATDKPAEPAKPEEKPAEVAVAPPA